MQTNSVKFGSFSIGVLKLAAAAVVLAGCGAADGGSGSDEEVGAETAPLITSTGPTIGSYSYRTLYDSTGKQFTAAWMQCGTNQVVVGWHRMQQKVLCVNLPPNIVSTNTSLQLPGASAQINGMQGCPSGQYIQAIANSGSTGYLYCAGFRDTTTNTPVLWTGTPTTDTGSQSNIVYGFSSPTMHVCPATSLGGGAWDSKVMVGLHIGHEYLACVR